VTLLGGVLRVQRAQQIRAWRGSRPLLTPGRRRPTLSRHYAGVLAELEDEEHGLLAEAWRMPSATVTVGPPTSRLELYTQVGNARRRQLPQLVGPDVGAVSGCRGSRSVIVHLDSHVARVTVSDDAEPLPRVAVAQGTPASRYLGRLVKAELS
jgi:hypothetical protein